MQKIKKLQVHSKKLKHSSSAYSPIFSTRTKVLVLSGLCLMLFSGVYNLNKTIQLAYFVPSVPTSVNITTYPGPTQLTIPSLGIELPIENTTIRDNVWTISPNGVSHLSQSTNPGEAGPGIYYGHNTNKRLGPIRWIKKNALIEVTTSDTKKHRYRVTETKQVGPQELSVFFSRKGEAVYLFTCDGFADLKRFIVIAEPVNEQALNSTK